MSAWPPAPYFPPPPPPPPPPFGPGGLFPNSHLVNNGCGNPLNSKPCIKMVINTRFGIFTTTTLVLWDYFTTLDDEIRYIWLAPNWCYTKVGFLLVRYLTLTFFLLKTSLTVMDVPPEICNVASTAAFLISSFIMLVISALLAARTWSIYGRSHLVLLLILLFHIVVYIPAVILITRPAQIYTADRIAFELSRNSAMNPVERSLLGGCYLTGYSVAYMWLSICTIITETGMWAMMAVKMWRFSSPSHLAKDIFRDGTVYYVVMFAALVAGAVSASKAATAGSRAFVGSAYFIGIRSVACCHTILRLRGYLTSDSAFADTLLRSNTRDRQGEPTGASIRFANTPTQLPFPDDDEITAEQGKICDDCMYFRNNAAGDVEIAMVDLSPKPQTLEPSKS